MTRALLLLSLFLLATLGVVGDEYSYLEIQDGDDENPIYFGDEVVEQVHLEGLDQEFEALGIPLSNNITEVINAVLAKYPEEHHVDEEVLELPEYEDPRDVVDNAANLSEWMQQQQWRTFISTIGKSGSRRVRDVVIQYVTVRGGGDKGAMVMMIGRAQTIREMDETLYHFMNQGYDPIYVYAHRGQGESDRLLEDIDYPPHYVEKANDLVADFRTFLGMVRDETGSGTPLYVFCHSMGCGITLVYVIEEYQNQRPQLLNAVVGSAPYIKAITTPFPYSVAVGLSRVLVRLGMGKTYAPTKKTTFEKAHSYMAFHNNSLTHSYTRWQRMKDYCIENHNVSHGDKGHQGLCLYGLTSRMAKVIFDFYGDAIQPFMKKQQDGKLLAVPMLMQTGSEDRIVEKKVTTDFCDHFVETCTNTEYEGSRHQVHSEVDSIRSPALAEMDLFMQSHSGDPTPQNSLPDNQLFFSRAAGGCSIAALLFSYLLATMMVLPCGHQE